VAVFDAILPAGGRINPAFAATVGLDSKALIEIGGEPILARTLRALNASGRVGRTVVIGPAEVREHPAAAEATFRLEEGMTGPENILRGLRHLQEGPDPPQKVLVVTTDLPFLTPELLGEFIDRCPPDRDICLPLVTREAFLGRFPNSTATFVPLRDGVVTAGCVYVIGVQALIDSTPYIERIFRVRKSKLGMARLLGPGFLFKFLSRTLTVGDVERKVQGLLNVSGAAIPDSPPELAFDIDYQDDWEYALAHAEQRG
jgi:GTP:adenosylcobinamide-phosphate guanylyltransferase